MADQEPSFDIYPQLDRDIEAAPETPGETVTVSPTDDLANVVQEEIASAVEAEELEDIDIDPSQATTLQELKEMLEQLKAHMNRKYEVLRETLKQKIKEESEDVESSLTGNDQMTMIKVKEFASGGHFDAARGTIDDHASSVAAKEDMFRAIDEHVLRKAESFASGGHFDAARGTIDDHASSVAAKEDMFRAIDEHVLRKAESFASGGHFDAARGTIDDHASSVAAKEDMFRAIDEHVLRKAESFASGGHFDAARGTIDDHASSEEVKAKMLELLGL